MKKFTVWFQVFGKKFKCTVSANDSEAAKALVKAGVCRSIKFDNIELEDPLEALNEDNAVKKFKEMFNL